MGELYLMPWQSIESLVIFSHFCNLLRHVNCCANSCIRANNLYHMILSFTSHYRWRSSHICNWSEPKNAMQLRNILSLLLHLFLILELWMLQNAFVVYMCELMIDIIKHSFIAKFNEIKPIVYSEFLEDLCKQVPLCYIGLHFSPLEKFICSLHHVWLVFSSKHIINFLLYNSHLQRMHVFYAPIWSLFSFMLLSSICISSFTH